MLVRNHIRGGDFHVLEQSGEQARAVSLGAQILTMRKLHDSVINKIDAASSSFWKAKEGTDGPAVLGLMDRQRLKMWLRDMYRELDDITV